MHNNYYFLRQLSQQLNPLLSGAVLTDCFTQNKDELYLGFTHPQATPTWLQIRVSPQFSGIGFPEQISRARRNSTDLFPDLLHRQLSAVKQVPNDRSFILEFTEGWQLLIKLHGNRSNLIVLHQNQPVALFKNKLEADWQTTPESLSRESAFNVDFSYQGPAELSRFWPTAGKEIKQHLKESGIAQKDLNEQGTTIRQLQEQLKQAKNFYIEHWEAKPTLTLFTSGRPVLAQFSSALAAANEIFRQITQVYFLQKRKQALLSQIQKKIKSTENYLRKTRQSLSALLGSQDLRQQADVLMANLHQVPSDSSSVTLHNFYTGQDQKFNLKQELNVQQNAERLYKKAKNQHKEQEHLETNLLEKEERLEELAHWQLAIEAATTHAEIKELEKEINPRFAAEDDRKPYWEEVFQGWLILVGRGAADNDEMLRYYAHKNDWWLHAKDVAGSHVLVKNKAGKPVPQAVMERAASLAAWHSKRRHDSLCPVICTPRKWVRKRKGTAAGLVVVEREEKVLLVKPQP